MPNLARQNLLQFYLQNTEGVSNKHYFIQITWSPLDQQYPLDHQYLLETAYGVINRKPKDAKHLWFNSQYDAEHEAVRVAKTKIGIGYKLLPAVQPGVQLPVWWLTSAQRVERTAKPMARPQADWNF